MAALLASQQKIDFSSKRDVAVGSASRAEKLDCFPPTKKEVASSLKKSLLSLVLVASFFQQSIDRTFHGGSEMQRGKGQVSSSLNLVNELAPKLMNYGTDPHVRCLPSWYRYQRGHDANEPRSNQPAQQP